MRRLALTLSLLVVCLPAFAILRMPAEQVDVNTGSIVNLVIPYPSTVQSAIEAIDARLIDTNSTGPIDVRYYPANNPSNYVTKEVTNGILPLASTMFYPVGNPSNYVTKEVTNGILSAASAATISATNALWSSVSGYVGTSVVTTVLLMTNQVFGTYTNDTSELRYLRYGQEITGVSVVGQVYTTAGSVSNWFDGSFTTNSLVVGDSGNSLLNTKEVISFNSNYYGTAYIYLDYSTDDGSDGVSYSTFSVGGRVTVNGNIAPIGASYSFQSFDSDGEDTIVMRVPFCGYSLSFMHWGSGCRSYLRVREIVILARPFSSININRVME